MLRTIILLLTAFTLFSAPARSIKVSGIVHEKPDKKSRSIIINECDISDKSKRCIAELDSAGRFEVSLPFYFGHTFTVNYKRKTFINAYAEPGDSIFISIDATGAPVEFHLSGNHAALNEEYSHAFCDLAPIYYDITLPPDTIPLSVYMPKFKSEVARTRAIVDRYIEEKSLHPETAELLYLDNIFIPANQAISFKGNGTDEQTAFLTDSLFDVFNERNVRVMIFPYHLSALMNRNPGYADIMPKSRIRDLMYATLGDAVIPPRENFADTAYYDRLYTGSENALDFSGIMNGSIAVMENDTVYDIENVNPVDWLKKRFPSRPVYLDVSATWCGPCRAALSAGEDVRKYFSDSDIIFAVIWLKSDLEAWKAFAPKIHNTVHIFIPDEDMSNSIMSALNMQGFPSYYFIERSGEISKDNIPHFNDPKLVDFLRLKAD